MTRLSRSIQRRFPSPCRGALAVLFSLALLTAGCDQGKEPDAVWLATGTSSGQVVYPRGLAYSKADDCFFVVDRMARIQRIEHDGTISAQWRMPKWEKGKPTGISVGPDSNVYVPDTHYARVVVFSSRGEFIREWGTLGTGPGQFTYPTDVAFGAQGEIFVSEYGDNDRIQVFDAQGQFLRAFGKFGDGDGEFSRPQSMVIDGDLLYVTDSSNHRIAVFTTQGKFVRNMGTSGAGPGQYRFPYGLDDDGHGHLIVAEFGNNRVQLIEKQTGRAVATWGVAGREPGQLAYPWAACADAHGRIAALDSGNNRIQVFRF